MSSPQRTPLRCLSRTAIAPLGMALLRAGSEELFALLVGRQRRAFDEPDSLALVVSGGAVANEPHGIVLAGQPPVLEREGHERSHGGADVLHRRLRQVLAGSAEDLLGVRRGPGIERCPSRTGRIQTRVRYSWFDSAWDPRALLTLKTRMEHGDDVWCATSVAEVPGRAA